jgi:Glutathione S-transferase, N-terminal domain
MVVTRADAPSPCVAPFRSVKLYVCWGLFPSPRPGGHPCKNAYDALREAGHDPEVVKSYGLALLPDALNRTHGRREAKRLTGKTTVPVLVTDDGEAIWDSKNIVAWAREHPAHDGDSEASPTAASGPPA